MILYIFKVTHYHNIIHIITKPQILKFINNNYLSSNTIDYYKLLFRI